MKKVSDKGTKMLGDLGASKPFLIGTYSVLFVVALTMTIMNIATDKGLLTVATGAFAILIFFLWVPYGQYTTKTSEKNFGKPCESMGRKAGCLSGNVCSTGCNQSLN